MSSKSKLRRLVPLCTLLLSGGASQAATVVWSAAQNVSTDTEVITTGTLVSALHYGTASNYTVNTVLFTGQNSGVANWTGYATGMTAGNTLGTITSPYTSALDGCVYRGGFGSVDLPTFTGLTAGHSYQFQVWFCDLRDASVGRMQWDTGASTPSMILTSNGTGVSSFAQFTIGSFIADGTSQTFRITGLSSPGDAGPIVNMFQLRDLGAVPEPSTSLLMGAGVSALLLRRRRVS